MRSTVLGLFFALIVPTSGSAAITYTISQPAYDVPGFYNSAIDIEFTVPSLITTLTTIPAADVDFSSGLTSDSLNLSLISVEIDPGLGVGAYRVAPGVPWIDLSFGVNGEQYFGESACFVDNTYGCTSRGATPFDHFGTYTNGPIAEALTLIIAPAVPEPSFKCAVGLCALSILVGARCRKLTS